MTYGDEEWLAVNDDDWKTVVLVLGLGFVLNLVFWGALALLAVWVVRSVA